MKKVLFISVWAVCFSAQAQSLLTLDSCITYAIAHSTDVRRQRLEKDQSRYEARTAALDFLPTIQGQVSGQFAWGRNIDPETNTYNTITTFNNYYSLSASVSLFDGGQTLNAFRRAKRARAQAATALQKAADDKAIAVMTKFVDAVYNRESVSLAKEKLADSRALLRQTQRMYELGEKSRPDVAQMESQVAEDDYNLLHQQNQARLTLIALKSEMNWPIEDSLTLSETDPAAPAIRTAGADNPAVRLAMQKAVDLKYAWLISKGSLLPSITLGGGIQTSFYRNLTQGGSGIGSFGNQFHNNMGEYVYASLSIPIFTPSTWRSVRRAKTAWKEAQIDAEDAKRKFSDDRAQAILDRDGYRREITQMERKVAADSLAYHLSTRKYEEGMLSTFDLHTAAQTLLESRIKLLQSRLLLTIKERLADYYNGTTTW